MSRHRPRGSGGTVPSAVSPVQMALTSLGTPSLLKMLRSRRGWEGRLWSPPSVKLASAASVSAGVGFSRKLGRRPSPAPQLSGAPELRGIGALALGLWPGLGSRWSQIRLRALLPARLPAPRAGHSPGVAVGTVGTGHTTEHASPRGGVSGSRSRCTAPWECDQAGRPQLGKVTWYPWRVQLALPGFTRQLHVGVSA